MGPYRWSLEHPPILPRFSTVTLRRLNMGDEYMSAHGLPRTCTEMIQSLLRKAWKGGMRVESCADSVRKT